MRYGGGEDVGLNYLPFSRAPYGLRAIVPILARGGRQVSILPASELQPDMLNYFDVIYVGLFSGMALLEDVSFMGSGFHDRRKLRRAGRHRLEYHLYQRGRAGSPRRLIIATTATLPGSGRRAARWWRSSPARRDTGLRAIAPIAADADLLPGARRRRRRRQFRRRSTRSPASKVRTCRKSCSWRALAR